MLENMCTSTTAAYLLEMPESALEYLTQQVEGLPKFTSMQEAILKSEESIQWAIEGAKRADRDSRLEEFVSELLDGNKDEIRKVHNLADNLESLVRVMESVRPLIQKLADATALPPTEYERYFKEHVEFEFQRNPLAVVLINADAYACRSEEIAACCRLEALKAAIDIQRRGKAALLDHLDPYETEPFGYEDIEGGYRLISKFRYTGKKEGLELTFGMPRRAQGK
ncbi:hypothetical protein [Schlesneria paludicola]|uniref:hypothetical protein n=1 Tax=Schlesneria paludicola TaxID=360056 RepID=UPI00138AF0FB|nr:hypothetical protein [Schlesneria paludicola]